MLGEQSGENNTYNNTKWSHAGSGVTDKEFASIQTESAAAFAEPLVVEAGDQVALTLGYDLNNIVDANTDISEKVPGNGIYHPGFADDCETVSTVKTCAFFPDVCVSATTE